MGVMDSGIVKFYGTTDNMFLKEETTRITVPEMNNFFSECIDVLMKLNYLKNIMISESKYIQMHPDEMFGPGEYYLYQISLLEDFVTSTLSVEFVAFTETQVPTKPVVADKMYIFIETFKTLWDKCNDVVTMYDMGEEEANEISELVNKALYNLTVFVIIQYNLECSVLQWSPNNTLTKNICSTVVNYCDKNDEDIEHLIGLLKIFYDTTKPRIEWLEDRPTKMKEFINLIQYTYFDLQEVPEMTTEKVINEVLGGRKSVDEYVTEVNNLISSKYGIE